MRPKSILKNNPENILNHSRKVSIKTRVGDETRSRSRIRTRGHSRSGSDRVKTPMDNWDGNGSTIAGRRSLSTIKQLQELEKVKNMESLGDGRSVRANRDWDDRERGRRYRDYERKEVARSDLFIPKPADYYDPYPKPSPMRTRTRILLDKLTTGKTLTKPMLSFDEIEASIKDILSKNNIRRDTYKSHVDIDTRPRPVPRLRQPKVLFPNHKSQIQRHKFQQTTVVDKCDSGCQATFVYPEINKCSVLVQTEMEEVEKGGGKLFGDLKKFEGNRPKVGYDEYKDESENEREQKELKTLIVKKKSPPISSITKPIALKLQDLQIKEIPKFVKPQVKSSDKYVVNIPTRPQTAPGLVRGNGKVVISKTNYSDIRFKKVGFESPENSFLFSEEYIKDAKSKVGAHVKVKSPMMARKTVDQYTHMSDNEELKDKELKDKDKLTTFNESKLPNLKAAPSSGPPKSILKRSSVIKREEETEVFAKDSYRNREFHVDPTLFKHFEKAHVSQKPKVLASKTKRTAKRVSSDIVPDRREEISTESAQNMTIGQMENENSTLPTGHYEAQHISLHSNDYAMQSQMMPAPPHFQPQIHYVTQTMQPMQPIQQQQRLLIHPNQQYRYHQAPLQYHHRNPYPPQQQSPPLVYGGYQEEYNPNYHIHEGYLDGRSYNNPHQLYFNEPIQNEYRQPFLPELPIKKAPISRRKPVSLGPRTLNYVKTVKVPIRKPYPDVYIPLSQTIPYERVVPRKVGQPSRSLKMLGNHAKDSISKNPRGSFRQLYATINPSL